MSSEKVKKVIILCFLALFSAMFSLEPLFRHLVVEFSLWFYGFTAAAVSAYFRIHSFRGYPGSFFQAQVPVRQSLSAQGVNSVVVS